MNLVDLIQSDVLAIDVIGRHLDELSAQERLKATRSLGRDDQRRLYEKAAQAAPISLEHFVSPERAAREQVRHFGRNTLPLPGPFRLFEKRFTRPGEGPARLFGYNEGLTRPVVGPGYFVAYATAGRPAWEARGAIVIDYFQVPDGDVAHGWPRVVPNQKGLQRFVFHGTRDFMRRVSDHVSIGAAFKGERPMDHYFILCREA